MADERNKYGQTPKAWAEISAPDTLVDRLRGVYRTPIRDGLGPAGGDDNPNEFVRTYSGQPPIQYAAADRIEELEHELAEIKQMIWLSAQRTQR